VSKRRTQTDKTNTPSRPSVKTTVVLDADTHTKLIVAANLRGVDRSTYAAGILKEELKTVVCFDRAMSSDSGESSDRQGRGLGVRDEEEEAA
jgi:hypothetical protein